MQPSRDIARLIEIMAALRTPGSGCPWDLEQSFATIAPYTIEEAYEVADAVARGDLHDLRDELGDLLLQVVFHARMAEETARSTSAAWSRPSPRSSCGAIPTSSATPRTCRRRRSKACGRRSRQPRRPSARRRGRPTTPASRRHARRRVRSPCPPSPAPSSSRPRPAGSASTGTTRAQCSPRSARRPTRSRPRSSVEGDASTEARRAAAQDEVGDLLFAVVNLARHLDVDPEAALRGTNDKFTRRFAAIEAALEARGKSPQEFTLAEMDALWDAAKAAEKAAAHRGAE